MLFRSAPGPVGYWNMDDATGTTAKDLSGNGNNGTLTNGPTWLTDGKFGGAVKFDGSNDYVGVSSSSAFQFAGDFSIGFWAKGTKNTRNHAFSIGSFANSDNLDFDFNDSYGIWVYWNGGGTNRIRIGTVGQYTDNIWRHYTLKRSGSTVSLYINGVEVGNTIYSSPIGSSTTGMRFGTSAEDRKSVV